MLLDSLSYWPVGSLLVIAAGSWGVARHAAQPPRRRVRRSRAHQCIRPGMFPRRAANDP